MHTDYLPTRPHDSHYLPRLREVKLIVYICRVLVALATEASCRHLGTESRIVLGDLALLVPSKGIATQV